MKDPVELTVSDARDSFSDAVNRAAYGGEVTYITRGRGRSRAAAIVPAELVEEYEALVEREDAQIAAQLLADIRSGESAPIPADEVYRELGL